MRSRFGLSTLCSLVVISIGIMSSSIPSSAAVRRTRWGQGRRESLYSVIAILIHVEFILKERIFFRNFGGVE